MPSWIYVIEAVGQHLFKVGLTTTAPENRLRQLQTSSPHKLSILTAFTCSEPERVEAEFHCFLNDSFSDSQRSQGEWFALTRESMLEIMMTFFGMLAQGEGLTLIKPPPKLNASDNLAKLVRSCRVKGRTSLDLDAIRQRVFRATEGREFEKYSVFPVSGSARVGDIGGDWYGVIDVPFEALAVGGPTNPKYNDHVMALIPKVHGDAEANAEFCANARSDILALLNELDRMTREEET